jgi:hypothetical protein
MGVTVEGDDQPIEPDDGVARVDRLGSLLRDVRRRLEHYQTLPAPSPADAAAWDADLYTYDDALVSVADLLDVEVSARARDELTPDDRAELEAEVTAAGLDLGGGPGREAGDEPVEG